MKDFYEKEKYKKAKDYSISKNKIGFLSSTISFLLVFSLLVFNGYGIINDLVSSFESSYIKSGLFFLTLFLINTLISLPFSYYNTFVIEEKFIGEEFSLMSFGDGKGLKHMPAVQDHKRAYKGDTGPNTGGMGTYSDANHSLPFLNENDITHARMINEKTAEALQKEVGEGYKGILYGGFMATANGVKLIEYNARLGDPEAMNVLSILKTDIIDIFNSIGRGTLNELSIDFDNKATVCKYAVPEGYPDEPIKGKKIDITSVLNKDSLFFASVDIEGDHLIEAGSWTVAVVGIASSISKAEKIAEEEISKVDGPLFHREDIGTDDLIRARVEHMESLRWLT